VGNGVQRVSSAFLTELPQKGMARIFLATQVLHRPINPGFTHCAASRFMLLAPPLRALERASKAALGLIQCWCLSDAGAGSTCLHTMVNYLVALDII
jgi:hypothetical protein